MAASGSDKLAEMESLRASPSRHLKELLGTGVEWLSHRLFRTTILQIHVALICLQKERTDNVQIWVQFKKAISNTDKADLSYKTH